jgi:hypothetical protein
MLKWIFKKQDAREWVRIIQLWIEIRGKLCEHRNEPSASIKCLELLEELRNY